VIETKEVYAYNVDGKRTLYENLWRSGDELHRTKKEYEFDDDGNESFYAEYFWDDSTNDWKGHYQRSYHEKDASGNYIVVIEYRWNDDGQWVENYYINYPDVDQTAPIALNPVEVEVTESGGLNYEFNLESLLLPSLTGYGEVTYTIGTITDDYNILGNIN
jgi:hypothetical protein